MDESLSAEQQSLATHVAVCSVRYEGINARLKRLEYAIYALIAALLANGSGPVTHALLKAFGG